MFLSCRLCSLFCIFTANAEWDVICELCCFGHTKPRELGMDEVTLHLLGRIIFERAKVLRKGWTEKHIEAIKWDLAGSLCWFACQKLVPVITGDGYFLGFKFFFGRTWTNFHSEVRLIRSINWKVEIGSDKESMMGNLPEGDRVSTHRSSGHCCGESEPLKLPPPPFVKLQKHLSTGHFLALFPIFTSSVITTHVYSPSYRPWHVS